MNLGDLDFKNRSTGLVGFGLVVIVIGVGCALMAIATAGFVLLSLFQQPAGHPDAITITLAPRAAVPSLSLYLLLAIALITLGVGSIRAREWARQWLLSVAWIWLLTGLTSMFLAGLVWTSVLEFATAMSELPRSWVIGALAALFVLGVLFHIVLPGIMILFYRSRDVIETCRSRDQNTVDRPVHVLSLSLVFFLLAYSALLLPVYGFPIPFFGILLHGVPGILVIGGTLSIYLWLGWSTLKRQPTSWWVGLTSSIVVLISTTLTVAVHPISRLLESTALSEDEQAVLQIYASMDRPTAVGLCLATWLSLIVYQIYVKRFFTGVR